MVAHSARYEARLQAAWRDQGAHLGLRGLLSGAALNVPRRMDSEQIAGMGGMNQSQPAERLSGVLNGIVGAVAAGYLMILVWQNYEEKYGSEMSQAALRSS